MAYEPKNLKLWTMPDSYFGAVATGSARLHWPSCAKPSPITETPAQPMPD